MTGSHTERLAAALGGTYRIVRKLGEGGMASVYLAEDLKHERKVALKILRPELAAVIGGERFLSEIKTTANLQHPHILPLFDSGEADGYLYYVMPYIDGETLADKLARERQLGVEEAVDIARSVASALDYAHRHDVIHRDIKPANILLHDGNPIVADFGIALAVSAAGGGRMTETGLSLGTPHYMSPEQASADRDLSARSDVYSLGCVLYEMLAGQPPHTGPSAQNILIRILTERPQPLTGLRHTVPPHVSAVVAKAIEKLPADRFDSADDFARALDDPSFAYTPAAPGTTATPAPMPSGSAGLTPPTSRGWPRWVTAAAAVLALGAGYLLTGLTTPPPAPVPGAAFTLTADSTHQFSTRCCGRTVAISPQGDRIVYQGTDVDGTDRLYQRPLGQLQATAIPGTEGGRHPFFSPNGEWVGFFDQGTGLKKVRFDGAAPLPLAPVTAPGLGASWGENGDVYFSDRGRQGLWRVSEDGGEASPVAEPDTTVEWFVGWPAVLPGSERALVTVVRYDEDRGGLASVEVVELASGERSRVLENASDARYVEPGYLVFSDGAGSIMAQPFDLRTLEVGGERFRIADQAVGDGDFHSEYDISRNGTLVMLASLTPRQRSELVILDRAGNEEVLDVGRDARLPRFSPDGRHLAFSVSPEDRTLSDIWTWDLARGVPSRVTFEGDNSYPSWSPDGTSILFQRWMDGERHGYMVQRDGTGTPTRIIEREGRTPSMSSDGRWLVWGTSPEGAGSRIWVKETGSEDERMLLGGGFPEFQPAISPDGRWIAYVAEDDGDDQVYVQRFPDLGPRVKISVEGGREPRWSRDGSELFFRDYASGNLISVDVLPSEEVFEPGAFRELFSHRDFARAASATTWDVHPDGERFVFVRGESDGGTGAFSLAERLVITNAVSRER